MSNSSLKKKIPKPVQIMSAWIIVAVIAVISITYSLLLTSILMGGQFEAVDLPQRFAIIFGVAGFQMILLLIIIFWSRRKHLFSQQLLIGLWIGLFIYSLIFAIGVISFIAQNFAKTSTDTTYGCSTLTEQYGRLALSVAPILTEKGSGTGFAVNDSHTIMTAYHVIEGANSIKINFVDDERVATVVATAPQFDLALLRIDKPMGANMKLTEAYQVADQLYALGFPGNAFDAGQASLSSGILSRILSNDDLKLNDASAPAGLELVQTDMALNPGNSGGPIVNECGVIGIISIKSNSLGLESVSSEEGINYGVSSKTAASHFKLPLLSQ